MVKRFSGADSWLFPKQQLSSFGNPQLNLCDPWCGGGPKKKWSCRMKPLRLRRGEGAGGWCASWWGLLNLSDLPAVSNNVIGQLNDLAWEIASQPEINKPLRFFIRVCHGYLVWCGSLHGALCNMNQLVEQIGNRWRCPNGLIAKVPLSRGLQTHFTPEFLSKPAECSA